MALRASPLFGTYHLSTCEELIKVDSESMKELALLAFLILLNAFFAASEVAIITIGRARLKRLVEEGVKVARTVERLAEDSSRFLATMRVGVTLVRFFAVATAVISLTDPLQKWIAQVPIEFIAQASLPLAVFSIIIILAFFMLSLGELLPKNLAFQHAEPIALAVAYPIDLFATIALPLVKVLVTTSNVATHLSGSQPQGGMPFITEEEIKTMVDAGEETGIIEEDEKEMIYSIFELSDTLAREVMVPRIDIIAVESKTPLQQALDLILEKGHSRIPVYEETIDNIIGLLYAKDLLGHLRNGKAAVALHDILRPAYFIPETKKVDELLQDLQQRKVHMAIVVDEYGGTAGLVTIEDLIEEIVGEIQDEYDAEEPFIEVISDDEVIFNARIDLDDVNKLMNVELPSEVADTLGGFIYSQLGKVPKVGDKVLFDGIKIAVLSVVGRRIKKVKVNRERIKGMGEVKEKNE
jgi:putative hemolysin